MVKNYTSTVPASRSVQHIEDRLVKHGANRIFKLYDDTTRRLQGIAFTIAIDGKEIPFRLPAKVDRVEKCLLGSRTRVTSSVRKAMKDQAERTAWRILSDWVDVQMSLIELDQAELMEVFMPYIYSTNDDQTLFEKMKTSGFKLIEDRR